MTCNFTITNYIIIYYYSTRSEIYIVRFNILEHTTNMMISRTWCIAVSGIIKELNNFGESVYKTLI